MSIYNHSRENLMKHQNNLPNNISDGYTESSSLKNLYDHKFSSSAVMASFANNFHDMYHNQHHGIEQHHQPVNQQHLNKNFITSLSYSSKYPYVNSSHYSPNSYQPLTPPPHQEDVSSYNHQIGENIRSEKSDFKFEKGHNFSLGE